MKVQLGKYLVGSFLYGLQSENSDLDFVIIYRNDPRDYLTLGAYETTSPDEKVVLTNGVVVSTGFWDVKKFFQLALNRSYGAWELVKASDSGNVLGVTAECFAERPFLYHCQGVVNRHNQRGYMQALHFLFYHFTLQNKMLPPTVNASVLLNDTLLQPATRLHVADLFERKREGRKDLYFKEAGTLTDDSAFRNLPVPEAPVRFEELLRDAVFGGK